MALANAHVMGRCSSRLLAALCLVDIVTPWAPHAAQRWARHSARSANPQDVETARSADIVAVAESFGIDVNSRNKACCPFHDERTPSFTLNPDKGLYKCFGCGAGGDVIKLIRVVYKSFSEHVMDAARRGSLTVRPEVFLNPRPWSLVLEVFTPRRVFASTRVSRFAVRKMKSGS